MLPPRKRPGYRWVRRKGCSCEKCPWGAKCLGRVWPHWIEVKEEPVNGMLEAGPSE